MFFVSHSICTLQEGSGSIAATLGGGAGAEYGFGAYALGPVIPAGHAGAWEVKLVKEKRHDFDPTWLGEEFIVVGISTTASLAPDWSFFQKDKHRNPVAGINCRTGQVLVWGRTHAQYPPMTSGESIRVGVDLRGPRYFLVLHKHTPETPDRLLFQIALSERLERAYPAVIIFNRLSYTGREFSAELSLINPPPQFDFLAWMANAEVQERKRNGSAARGNRQLGARSSTSRSGRGAATGGGAAVVAGNRSPLKYLEPLPKAFNHHGDLLTRTCRLGVHLQRVSSRGPFGLHKKGVHTYLFRPKHGKYHVIGLSDGTWGGFPPLPPVFSFGLEYHSTGVFRILSSSGPTLERTLLSFACGVGGGGSSAASGGEVKIEVTMFRVWDEKAALAFARGGELSSTMLDVSMYLNGKSLRTESVVVMVNPAEICPFVGLIQEGDAISAVYAFSPLSVEAQIRWLSTCLATLENVREEDGGVHASSLERSLRPATLKGHLERLAELLSLILCKASADRSAWKKRSENHTKRYLVVSIPPPQSFLSNQACVVIDTPWSWGIKRLMYSKIWPQLLHTVHFQGSMQTIFGPKVVAVHTVPLPLLELGHVPPLSLFSPYAPEVLDGQPRHLLHHSGPLPLTHRLAGSILRSIHGVQRLPKITLPGSSCSSI